MEDLRKQPKPKTSADLKAELDKWFSWFIRLTYCNENGFVKCWTCDAIKHWKEMQCGHFVTRGNLATRFDERNCRPQCFGCNMMAGGNPDIMGLKLEAEYGSGIIAELFKKSQEITRYFPYQEEIDHYKEKVKQLKKEKNL